jgi:hypothetical protein
MVLQVGTVFLGQRYQVVTNEKRQSLVNGGATSIWDSSEVRQRDRDLTRWGPF